jgi:ankyrin repeat protein
MDDEGQSMLSGTEFTFDHQIINTVVYRRALLAAKKKKGPELVAVLEEPDLESKSQSTPSSENQHQLSASNKRPSLVINAMSSGSKASSSDASDISLGRSSLKAKKLSLRQRLGLGSAKNTGKVPLVSQPEPNTLSKSSNKRRPHGSPGHLDQTTMLSSPTQHQSPINRSPGILDQTTMSSDPNKHQPQIHSSSDILDGTDDIELRIVQRNHHRALQLYKDKQPLEASKLWKSSLRLAEDVCNDENQLRQISDELSLRIAIALVDCGDDHSADIVAFVNQTFPSQGSGLTLARTQHTAWPLLEDLMNILCEKADNSFKDKDYEKCLYFCDIIHTLSSTAGNDRDVFSEILKAHCYWRLGAYAMYDSTAHGLLKSAPEVGRNLEATIAAEMLQKLDTTEGENARKCLALVSDKLLTLSKLPGALVRDFELEEKVIQAYISLEEWDRATEILSCFKWSASTYAENEGFFLAYIAWRSGQLKEAKRLCRSSMKSIPESGKQKTAYLDHLALLKSIHEDEKEHDISEGYHSIIPSTYWESVGNNSSRFHQLNIVAAGRSLHRENRGLTDGRTLLVAATRSLPDVIACVQSGADVNYQASGGTNTALIIAAEKGSVDITRYLLKQPGIDVDKKGHSGRTALLQATLDNHVQIVKILLEAGANPTLEMRRLGTPVIQACCQGRLELMEVYLRNGVDINAKHGQRERTLLQYAAVHGAPAMMRFLLSKGADIVKSGLLSDPGWERLVDKNDLANEIRNIIKEARKKADEDRIKAQNNRIRTTVIETKPRSRFSVKNIF